MNVHGQMKIPVAKCCPFIFLAHHTMGLPLEKGCLDVPLNHLNNFLPFVYSTFYQLDWKMVYADESVSCKLDNDANYTCWLGIDRTMAAPVIGKLYIFYLCEERQSVDVFIDLTCEIENKTLKLSQDSSNCSHFGPDSWCLKYYNLTYTAFPNILGMLDTMDNINKKLKVSLNLFKATNCHKHAEELLCYVLFPPCIGEDRVLPCRSLCLEVFAYTRLTGKETLMHGS